MTLSLASCVSADAPVEEAAQRWAEAVCSKQSTCDCDQMQCLDQEANRFIAWSGGRPPNLNCLDDRILRINELGCDDFESNAFDWETRACPLWTNFAGINEPCTRPTDAPGPLSCENGLVCDHSTTRCVNPASPPRRGEMCQRSLDPEDAGSHCATGLRCDGQLCVDDAELTKRPAIVCSDSVYNL